MGGGRMVKNNYNSQSSSSSSMFNGDVRVLECWCIVCTRYVYCCNEKRLKMNECNLSVEIFPSN